MSNCVDSTAASTEVETAITFTAQQLRWCKKIVKNRDELEKIARAMYDSWSQKGWVPEYDESNYNIVWKNERLKQALLLHLAQQLSQDLEDISKIKVQQSYGCGLISPFNVYFNCYTDKDLNNFIREIKLLITSDQYKNLQAARMRLVTKMGNLRRDLIEAVNLVGTPARNYKPPVIDAPKPVKILTGKDVQEKINSISDSLSASASASAASASVYMDTEARVGHADDSDDESELESIVNDGEISTAGGKSGKRKAEQISLKDQLLQTYPTIATTGIILLINNDELEVIDVSCATCTRCNQPMG